MKHTKTLYAAGAGTLVGLAAFAGVASAQATSNTDGQTLVDKIAARFNLNKDDVQKVFDENRAEHQAEHQQKMEDRLNQAVTDGKITEDQKAKILEKQKEMQSFMDSLKDKTPEERHTLMKQKMVELQQWAKDNNIPNLKLLFGPGMHGRFGGHMMMKMDGTDVGAGVSAETESD